MEKSNGKVLRKCDFVIADSSRSCRGVVWEENMVELKENSSYKILNATVRCFNGAKYLSVGEQAIIKFVGEIGNITEELICDESGRILLVEGEIIGILKTDVYLGCRICNSKVTEVGNIGECTKCGAKVKIGKCKADCMSIQITRSIKSQCLKK